LNSATFLVWRTLLIALLVTTTIGVSGCANLHKTQANADPESKFVKFADDTSVRYEPGAYAYAQLVAWMLPAAIKQIENAHYRPFKQPLTIYICRTDECFSSSVVTKNVSAAVIPDNRLFLSPRLFTKENGRLFRILTHELSHVHLGQQIGHFSDTVPVWFHEGLAAYASEGGGAEYATDQQVRQAMREGRSFDPVAVDRLSSRKKAEEWELSTYLFYRESMMFMTFLRTYGGNKFRTFLRSVQDKTDFSTAFLNAFEVDLATAGSRFITSQLETVSPPAAPQQTPQTR
jgi:hypothetical protein